jgi:ABC-type multidrug transport system fused ATPase/permease subunit
VERVLLKDAPILNERLVRQALAELKAGRTTAVIVAPEGGRLVEQGTQADLLARGGHYARLVSRQLSALRTPAGA